MWIRRMAALLLCAALCLTATGCQTDSPYDKNFRLPLSGEPKQLDPQVCADDASRTVVLALFEGLTRLDDVGTPVAGVATKWEISDDGLTYTFTLGDSRWSDGTPVTAADFVYGIRRAADPATRSPLAHLTKGIVNAVAIIKGKKSPDTLGVTALDDGRLEIRLTAPDTQFLYNLSFPPFMPCQEAFFVGTGARYGMEAEYVLSNGAFSISTWSHNESVLLIRNEHYPRQAEIYPAKVRLVINAQGSMPDLLANGTLDAGELTPDEVIKAKKSGAQVVSLCDTVEYLWFNTTLPALSNATIRGALRDGVEWDGLLRLLDSAGSVQAEGFVPADAVLSGKTVYRTPQNAVTFVCGGEDAAQRLDEGLKAAGVSAMPTMTVLCEDNTYAIERTQHIIQSWQKHLGLYFHLEPLSASALRQRVTSGDYQIALWACSPPGSTAMQALSMFGSQSAANAAGFADAAFDKALQKAVATDRASVTALETRLLVACPAVPIAFVRSYYGVAAGVSGVVIHPFDGGVFGVRYNFTRALKVEE